MDKTPTAHEFLVLNSHVTNEEMLIKFARIKVQEALTLAAQNAVVRFEKRTGTHAGMNKRFVVNGGDVYTVDKHSILNAYPLDKIN